MLINYIYLDESFDSRIFKPEHSVFIPVLRVLEWFSLRDIYVIQGVIKNIKLIGSGG